MQKQKKYHQPPTELKQAIRDCANKNQAIHYENVGLQGKIQNKDQEIAFLKRRCMDYLTSEAKNYGITIIVKKNEATESLYIYMQASWL